MFVGTVISIGVFSECTPKAEEYLKGVRNYFSLGWLPDGFIKDGTLDIEFIERDPVAIETFCNLKIVDRYFHNIIEVDAFKA